MKIPVKLLAIFLMLVLSSLALFVPARAQGEQVSAEQIIKNIEKTYFIDQNFNILDFGAKPDEGFDNRPFIEKAVLACVSKGGGRVIIPPGTFYCKGPINLKSNVNLQVSKGATLLFSPDPEDYLPMVFTRWEGVEIFNYSPLIYTKDQENVAVTGKGTIDGNASKVWTSYRAKQKEAQNRLRAMGTEQVPVAERVFGTGDFLRTPLIQFINCKRILVEDVTLTNSPFWILHPVYSSNIVIRGVKFHSLVINNDGIDIDSSTEALIENCSFFTGDDAVVFKSGRDQDGWRVNKPSKNVVVRNCYAPQVLHGIAFGSEMSGGIENIFIENFKMDQVKSEAIQFKANKDRGGYIKNIYISNVKVDSVKAHLLFFWNNYYGYRGGNAPSEFHHIYIENVICRYAKNVFQLQGLEEKPIHHIYVKNLIIEKADHLFDEKEFFEEVFFENVMVEKQKIRLSVK
ncbi:MAG: glycoside hydrolase family 28 protein [Candidatus Cyclobacteriaceae bacterium M3_2C_046]